MRVLAWSVVLLLLIRPGMAQRVFNWRVDHVTMDSALRQISRKTGHSFLYPADLFTRIPPIDLKLENVGWEKALRACLAGLDAGVTPNGDSTSVIIARGDGGLHYTPLRGRVTGAGGVPLAGATVVAAGGVPALTDEQGVFSLPVRSFRTLVTISFSGYVSRTEVLSNREEVNIALQLPGPLDAVVVLPYDPPYGHTPRRFSTATAFEVRDTALGDAPVNNLLEALQGLIPGASIRQYNGVPGSAFEVLLGGRHSIQQGNDPLFIVDGVPWATNGTLSTIGGGSAQGSNGASALNGIPMSAIGSITVMNDAAATALYGSRASNGVILVTLKEGRAGKVLWTADVNGGVSRTVPTSGLLNTTEFLGLRREAILNDGRTVNDTSLPEQYQWDPTRYIDFKKTTMGGTGVLRNARVEVSGGGERDRWLMGGRYHKESAVYPGDFYDQDLSVNGSYHRESVNHRLKLGVAAVYNQENDFLPLQDLSQYQYLAPNTPAFSDASGVPQWGTPSMPFINILALTHNTYRGKIATVLAHGDLSYEFADHFFGEARVGYNGIFTREKSLLSVAGQIPFLSTPPVDDTTTDENDYNSGIVEGLVRYHGPLFGGRDQLDLLAGVTWQEQQTAYCSTTGILDGNGHVTPGATNASVDNRYAALFARANYVFRRALILSAALRRDGSTKFGQGFSFGNFWSVGGAWIFRAERPEARGLSFGKIKASYGTTGNEEISPRLYDTSTAGMVNRNLQWEVNHRAEAGVELGLFRNSMFFTAMAYRSWTDNQLIYYLANPLRRTFAHFGDVAANVVNKGLEFQLLAQGVHFGRLRWSMQLSVTVPFNRLQSFPLLDSTSLAGSLVVGHSLTATKSYHLLGVDPNTGLYQFQASGVGTALALAPGPSLDPKWYAGWSHSLQYGRLELRLFVEWRRQNGANPLAALARQNAPGVEQGVQLSNGPVEWLDHWRGAGDSKSQQRLTSGGDAMARQALQRYLRSDENVIGASYLRLKTAALYYRWKVLPRLRGVEGITLYLRGEDLFRVTRFPVTDPETQDPTVLPPMRVVELGFSVVFGKKAGPSRVADRGVVR
ncbi:MAG TPA: SusC/RagA family TonB-linked outer membrane protein [Puia sp.]|uniref:SusC/RagA family TonB-linked outer membrane protein n=1 Tax=Puia sp. TaxID=2045100 RepID=UPI002BDF5C02|nr:SusC/RagA family TonB-linked outer membrane protein [Puia sp.]HVU95474.1 SusC/RagA family TonB-linked outer membrane protein [Puia sp.]